jgi:hypothetical protein
MRRTATTPTAWSPASTSLLRHPSYGDEGQVNGALAVSKLWQGLIAAMPDLQIEPGRHLHADDPVFVEMVSSGTQQGEWIGFRRPAGGSVSASPACMSSRRTDWSASGCGSTSPPSCASSACFPPDQPSGAQLLQGRLRARPVAAADLRGAAAGADRPDGGADLAGRAARRRRDRRDHHRQAYRLLGRILGAAVEAGYLPASPCIVKGTGVEHAQATA